MRELLGGLDVGTTSVKALLVTPAGEEVALGRAPTVWRTTDTGAETDASTFVEGARAALADALRQVPEDRVVALGVASMAESGVLVDARDRPLAPVVAWHDHRDESQLRALVADLGGDAFSRRTGLPLWTQWSISKHRWLSEHEPATRSAARRYNVAEWVARDLGADPVTELSLASRTGWLDLSSGRPWAEALDWSGAHPSLLGDLVEAGSPVGAASVAGALAALDGATLTVAGHDHQAAVVGVGSTGTGDEFDSAGTAEAILRTVSPDLPADAVLALTRAGITVGWSAVRGHWCLLGATQGGLVLGRVLQALGVGRAGLADLDAAALVAQDRPDALTVTDAAEVDVAPGADPGEVWRAATRLVTAQARRLGETLGKASGPRRDLVVAGGWTNSAAVMAAKQDAFGPLRRATTTEAGARGAALLAGLAHGVYGSLDDLPNGARRAAPTDTHTDAPVDPHTDAGRSPRTDRRTQEIPS